MASSEVMVTSMGSIRQNSTEDHWLTWVKCRNLGKWGRRRSSGVVRRTVRERELTGWSMHTYRSHHIIQTLGTNLTKKIQDAIATYWPDSGSLRSCPRISTLLCWTKKISLCVGECRTKSCAKKEGLDAQLKALTLREVRVRDDTQEAAHDLEPSRKSRDR